MKIKLIIIVKNIDGGVGTFLNQLSNLPAFFNNGLDVFLLVLKKETNTFLSKFSYMSYFPHPKIRDYYNFGPSEISEFIKEWFYLKKEISKIKPDIVLSIDTRCNLLACLLKKISFGETKLILTNHNNVEKVMDEKLSKKTMVLVRLISRFLFSAADEIVCVSKGLNESFTDFFRITKKIHTIPYGINAEKAKLLGQEPIEKIHRKYFIGNKKRIISVGRLEKQKDFVTLIRAFKRVNEKIKNSELILIGEGAEKTILLDLVRKLEIENSVIFLGWQYNIFSFLRKSDIFVLSSNYEGFGYVLLEAMSQGLPIIVTNSPYGPPEVLGQGKYGVIVPVGNIDKMKDSILNLLKDKSEYKKYSSKSRLRISFYKEETMLQSYKNLIEKLVS